MKQIKCQCISPHLIDGYSGIVNPSSKPMFFSRQMVQGLKPTDGGNLILDEEAFETFKENEPMAMPYVKRFIGAFEMLHNRKRWCLWLVNASEDILELPMVADRIDRCHKIRMDSASRFPNGDMAKLVSNPHLFRENIDFNSAVVIPRHLTENASRMPVDIVDCSFVVGNSCSLIPDGDLIDFAFLSSAMHMAWVKNFCGRLEARLRHSVSCCYNTFPVPEATSRDRLELAEICERILAERRSLQTELIRLCRNETIPDSLRFLYNELDLKINSMYNPNGFASDRERLNCLFRMYEEKTSDKPLDINQWC